MTIALTRENLFKPTPQRSETKADVTTKAAQSILIVETAMREAKTERLRTARLAQETTEPLVAPKKRAAASRVSRRS